MAKTPTLTAANVLISTRLLILACMLCIPTMLTNCGKKERSREAVSAEKSSEVISARTLGLAYLEENKLEEADEQFKKLIELAPGEALGYANLGLVYLRMGKLDDAEKQLTKALELNPDDPDIRLNLVKVYEMSDQKEKAITELKKNIEIDPDHVKSLYSLAETYGGSSDRSSLAEWEKYMQQIVDKRPLNIVARLQLIEAKIRNNKLDEAVKNLEEIGRQFPDFPKDASEYYDKALLSLKNSDEKQGLTNVIIFHNFLKLTNEYQAGIQELKGDGGPSVGFPVITFSQAMPSFIAEGESILSALRFTDATGPAGLNLVETGNDQNHGSSAHITVDDIDRDSDQDVYFGVFDPATATYRHFLLQNEMGRYTDITSTSKINHAGRESAATFGDYDNDGHLDLYIVREGGNKLYFNKDVGIFDDLTAEAGVTGRDSDARPLFFDYDHDGDLDLLLTGKQGNLLYRNNTDGTFTNTTDESGIETEGAESVDACFADFDDDGDIDLFVANSTTGCRLFSNIREGKFRDITEASGILGNNSPSSVATADYNNDGFPDLFITTSDPGQHTLMRNKGDGTFEKDDQVELRNATLSIAGHDAVFFDFDNDGYIDLLLSGESNKTDQSGLVLLHNNGKGIFENTSHLLPESIPSAHRIAVADYNLDGDLDIYLAGDRGIRLLRNDGGNVNRHLKMQLVGVRTGSGKNNYYGIGSKVEVRSGDHYQMRTVTNASIYFGLAQKEKADVVRILWTNGTAQNIFSPGSDQNLVEEQMLKGSCPFLYAWNGDKYEFVKDIMWRSALGMPLGIMGGNTTYAFSDASKDYIKIDGQSLKPQNGVYSLQLTGELWETLYIDKVKLIAVDHPADLDVFVDESFSPPPFPELRLYAIKNPKIPVSAINQHGNDVLNYIAQKDDSFLADFRQDRYQGVTETHELILDLGTGVPEDNLYLFLNGWIFPTDASINKAISQSSRMKVISPYIEGLDRDGKWVIIKENIGFPMGKDKTMIVDLSGVFKSESRLIRIRTNQEIYWDYISFGACELTAPVTTRKLILKAADLHYRGFSRLYRKGGRYGPHWFDYEDVATGQKWRDLTGYYTRYGDVTELLRDADDQYIIANAGDEISLSFDTGTDELPEGWTRDFLIYSEGWVKDGDLNTAMGQTVEPLPFHGMKNYPYDATVSYPSHEQNSTYQKTYNTRKVTTTTFSNAIRDPQQQH